MPSTDRRALILDKLRQDGRVMVDNLAEELGTSDITVRRDLEQLATEGALRRVRGGAVSMNLRGEGLPFSARSSENDAVKQRLAEATNELISDGEAVIIDSGTTGAAVARVLSSRRITAMPMSTQAIAELAQSEMVTLLLSGGSVRPTEGAIVGPLVDTALTAFRFDTAVLTCCGADPRTGVTAYDITDAAAKRAIFGSANRRVLVLESAKFAKSAMAVVCRLQDVDIVVTDSGAPEEIVRALTDDGVRVVIV